MKEIRLFKTRAGADVTNLDLLRALEQVGTSDAQALFMHTELSFGTPDPAVKRGDLLGALFEVLSALRVPTLCVPTFTFSFCNGEDYDVAQSRSRMGVFNEYLRKLPQAVRSADPLMSVAALGVDRDLVENLGHASIGAGSTFDKLHQRKGAKFLFFGARLGACLTYTHYVEEREGVPYRYNRAFTGRVTQARGTTTETYQLYVRYRNVTPDYSGRYEKFLLEKGLLQKCPCGDSSIACIDEPTVYETIQAKLKEDIDFFLAEPYPRQGLDPTFAAQNMVAL